MNNSEVVLFNEKSECCGCGACAMVCSQKAIKMLPDDEGYEYPVIDRNKCVTCKMCLNVCPIKKADESKGV